MKDYSAMSDFEINKSVANTISIKPRKTICFISYQESEDIYPDYCNNPADAWPIIIENKINIRFGAEGFYHEAQFLQYGRESVEAYHKNPLRAAMIVYLKMMEQKK